MLFSRFNHNQLDFTTLANSSYTEYLDKLTGELKALDLNQFGRKIPTMKNIAYFELNNDSVNFLFFIAYIYIFIIKNILIKLKSMKLYFYDSEFNQEVCFHNYYKVFF